MKRKPEPKAVKMWALVNPDGRMSANVLSATKQDALRFHWVGDMSHYRRSLAAGWRLSPVLVTPLRRRQ